jgi:hypothetical protein
MNSIMRIISIVTLPALFMLPTVSHGADTSSCYTTYYASRDGGCVDALIKELPAQDHPTANIQGGTLNPALLGFFAELFTDDQHERAHILTLDAPTSTKLLFTAALYEAGQQNDAQTYANANGLSEEFTSVQSEALLPIKRIKPIDDPAANDVLIGAYMASGNSDYIKRILGNFSEANDDMVQDGLRLAMMQGKFGSAMTPPGRETHIMRAACQKYACKQDMHNLMRVMTLSSAYWALQSLSRQDAGIKKIYSQVFEGDPRLNQLLTIESAAFGNYMTTLAAYAAFKDNVKINNSLSIYENLGSAQDAAAAIMAGNKN